MSVPRAHPAAQYAFATVRARVSLRRLRRVALGAYGQPLRQNGVWPGVASLPLYLRIYLHINGLCVSLGCRSRQAACLSSLPSNAQLVSNWKVILPRSDGALNSPP